MTDGGRAGRLLVAAVVTVMLVALVGAAADCPSVCECRWKGGKQTVECMDQGLRTIPRHMDTRTQVLDMSGNNIQILAVRKFQRMGLTNLQRIYMRRCKISQVDDHALLGLTNLVELDLSDNFLTEVPGRTFSDTPALMRLLLSGNPIRHVARSSLASLRELTALELSRCEIETVEPGVFAELTRLEWLRLDGNRLRQLDTRGLRLSLHGVELHDNAWRCDCQLRPLRSWLLQYKVPPAVEPRCREPARLAGRPVRRTPEHELACLPVVSPTSMLLEVAEEQNVTLGCSVRAEPPANVSWSFNGRLLGGAGAVFYRPYAVSENSEQGGLLRRSQLVVTNATEADQGVFQCRAENQAGAAAANYTLRVLLPPGSSSSESAPPARAGYAAAVGASLVFLAVLLVILVCIVTTRCARRRQRRQAGSPAGKAGVVNVGVDTPTSTCSMPKTIQMGTAPTRAAADCREHVTYIGQRCCTSPSRRSADSNPDVVSDTERGGAGAEPAYERVRPPARLGPVWRPDEPAPLVHVDVHPAEYPGRTATIGRSRSYHHQLASPPPLGYRSLPRQRPPPPPLRTSSAAEADGLVLQEVRPGRGLPSPPAGPLDSPPPLAPPAGFTDDDEPAFGRARRRQGDPNTAGLPPAAPAKFGAGLLAAHSSVHESPDEGYDESAGDGTEV